MNALEFSGKIEGGVIRLPEGYEEYDNSYARVLLLLQEPSHSMDQKNKLEFVFRKMENKALFSEISTPVEWQKRLRDEWE